LALTRSIVQQYRFLGPQSVAENGLREICRRDAHVLPSDFELLGTGRDLRFDSEFAVTRKNKQTSFGAGMFDGGAH
jgi:hypothetical protein